MPLDLTKEDRAAFVASMKRYAETEWDHELGDLAAGLWLDYVLAEIAPTIYNRAIRDAQTRLQEHVLELDGTCYEPEKTYWKR